MKLKTIAKAKVPPIAAGTYPAVCVGVYDLGEQYSEKFKNYSHKLKIVWEIPSETIEIDGEQKPRQLSKDYAASVSAKSSLRAHIQSWLGRAFSDEEIGEFEVFSLLGNACLLSVVQSENGQYANVNGVVAMPKGIPAPKTETQPVAWDIDAWDDAVFEAMPEWYQEQIRNSTQYQKLHAPTEEIKVDPGTGEVVEGGVPF